VVLHLCTNAEGQSERSLFEADRDRRRLLDQREPTKQAPAMAGDIGPELLRGQSLVPHGATTSTGRRRTARLYHDHRPRPPTTLVQSAASA
jgi:hypothetical protein